MAIERAMVEEVEERVHSWGRRHPVLRIAAIGLLSLLLLLSAAAAAAAHQRNVEKLS